MQPCHSRLISVGILKEVAGSNPSVLGSNPQFQVSTRLNMFGHTLTTLGPRITQEQLGTATGQLHLFVPQHGMAPGSQIVWPRLARLREDLKAARKMRQERAEAPHPSSVCAVPALSASC